MSRRPRLPMISGDEVDAFSRRSRHMVSWRPGVIPLIKRRYNKRVRRVAKLQVASEPRA